MEIYKDSMVLDIGFSLVEAEEQLKDMATVIVTISVTRIRSYRNPCSSPQGNLLMVITCYDNLLVMYNLTVVTLIV